MEPQLMMENQVFLDIVRRGYSVRWSLRDRSWKHKHLIYLS